MNRPKGLLLTAWMMVALELVAWLRQYWPHPVHLHTFSIVGLLVARTVAFICIFYYVRGQNWARIAVLLTSVLTILSLLRLRHEDTFGQVTGVAWSLLGVFFLYWLNTRPVREFFTRGAVSVERS
jgi:hypothetical protein